ncbi:MAG TPA: lasso peptide biosynthesis B2 protein [Vicinamibacterales bacterium]|nr:lasso peptide biosynthesis B2 protein [Vicinamibacterales bacterium]
MTARPLRRLALVSRAWIELARFDLRRPAGFARQCALLGRTSVSAPPSLVTAEDVVWAVDEACVWYVKRAACLQRSFVAARLLRRCGFAAEMVIGCRPLPFESHAWVEIDGRVVNDLPQYRRAFTVLNRL